MTGESTLREAVVDIRASFLDVQAETKATMGDFANDADYGIFACISVFNSPAPASPYMLFKPSLWNSKARKENGVWKYHNVSNYTTGALYSDGASSTKFVLQGRNDDKTADLYAYSPYTLAAYVSGPTAIPFTRVQDVRYAVQNSSNANCDLDPASGTLLSATFSFRRMMSHLKFVFTLDTQDNTVMDVALVSIENKKPTGGSAVLYTGGTYNAITGTFNSGMETADVVTSGLGHCSVGSSGGSIGINLVPTPISVDDEWIFTFRSGAYTLPPFVLKKAYVEHSDHSFGFLAGYEYTFHFTLDNYVRFDGFNIQSWGDLEEDTLSHGVI